MEWIETTGTTLDEAKERALDRLGVAEDEMEVETMLGAVLAIHHPCAAPAPRALFDCCDCCGIPCLMSVV